jgi:hypothetical protein
LGKKKTSGLFTVEQVFVAV